MLKVVASLELRLEAAIEALQGVGIALATPRSARAPQSNADPIVDPKIRRAADLVSVAMAQLKSRPVVTMVGAAAPTPARPRPRRSMPVESGYRRREPIITEELDRLDVDAISSRDEMIDISKDVCRAVHARCKRLALPPPSLATIRVRVEKRVQAARGAH